MNEHAPPPPARAADAAASLVPAYGQGSGTEFIKRCNLPPPHARAASIAASLVLAQGAAPCLAVHVWLPVRPLAGGCLQHSLLLQVPQCRSRSRVVRRWCLVNVSCQSNDPSALLILLKAAYLGK